MTTKYVLYLFLFSVTFTYGQFVPSSQNPKFNSSINPKYTTSINPKYNSRINPKYNPSINPNYSSDINPKYTSHINPKYNSKINPEFNSEINPKYNSKLNPSNGPWEGMYMFDEEANLIGFLAYASSDIYLLYDIQNKWIGYFVRSNSNFNLFSLDAEWTGQYLCSDSKNGFNLFNPNGEWTGSYVK